MQQGPGGVRGEEEGGAGQRRRTAWILASRGEAKRRSLCGDQLGETVHDARPWNFARGH